MLNKIKLLGHYLEIFFLSILVFLFTSLLVCKMTILKEEYTYQKISEKQYQEGLEDIQEKMKNSMISSGINKKVITDTFTIQDIKKSTKELLDILYQGKKKELELQQLEEKLRENITKDLAEKNFIIEQEKGLDDFVNSIMQIYKDEFAMGKLFSPIILKIGNIIPKINNYLNSIIIGLGILLGLWLFLRRKKIFLKISVPLLTTSFLLLFGTYYIKVNSGIESFTIINTSFSKVIRLIISSTFEILQIISYIYLFLGFIFAFLSKKNKKTN